MLYRSLMICGLAATSAFMAPAMQSKVQMSKISMGGKGFGGGEATRDQEPTSIDPNDPKGKQGAIHKAESFAEFLARRPDLRKPKPKDSNGSADVGNRFRKDEFNL